MIRSMTGYGRCTDSTDGYDISFDIRSVNNRFLDVSIRVPRAYPYLEEKIKKLISSSISRGKVDAFLNIENYSEDRGELLIDEKLLGQYYSAIKSTGEKFGISGDISAANLLRFPDVFIVKSAKEDEDGIWKTVEPVVKRALGSFVEAREAEGENLKKDLLSRLDTLEKLLGKVKLHSAEALEIHRAKLEAKLKEYLGELKIDEGRLLTEVGIIADRIDTGEEITRLESHIKRFRNILSGNEPSGKNLDFLTQELNRETNTIGSKCSLVEITALVIEMKNETERIREQIQNIE